MPKGTRVKSESRFYHVVPKGLADQLIFEDDGDRRRYVSLLRKAKGETGLLVHAYCLMSNHVHLLLEDPDDALGAFMKLVDERYGAYYAEKICRTGGIFRKPFWSEPVDTDEHFLCAVRYVHANPAAAGLCPASAYSWSSAKDYLGRDGLADTRLVLDMLGGREGFVDFSRAARSTAVAFEGSGLRNHLSDDEALRIARQVLGHDDVSLASLARAQRTESVRLLRGRGFTIRQVARICGIGEGFVSRC